MRKNVTITVYEISNCYCYGVEIQGLLKKEMKNDKKSVWNVICNPTYKEQYYDLSYSLDDYIEFTEKCSEADIECYKNDLISLFIEEYCEKNNIDYSTAIIRNYAA